MMVLATSESDRGRPVWEGSVAHPCGEVKEKLLSEDGHVWGRKSLPLRLSAG